MSSASRKLEGKPKRKPGLTQIEDIDYFWPQHLIFFLLSFNQAFVSSSSLKAAAAAPVTIVSEETRNWNRYSEKNAA